MGRYLGEQQCVRIESRLGGMGCHPWRFRSLIEKRKGGKLDHVFCLKLGFSSSLLLLLCRVLMSDMYDRIPRKIPRESSGYKKPGTQKAETSRKEVQET